MFARVLVLAILLLMPGAVHAEVTPAALAVFEPRLTIYLAKGAPDSCGPGCDRWIAVEGEVDREAAPRIRRFLAAVKDTQRPIYFHSPGGNVEQSYVIGRLLRHRKAVARVGRTIVTGCGADTPIDAACLKIKNAGGEVEAALTTRYSMCNSACSYLLLGATSREVAPDAAVGVHDSKLTVIVHGHPPPGVLAEFRRSQRVTSDRDRVAYIAAMGIGSELNDLVRTVKFEDRHILTRAELYRFGIDTRPFAETAWTLSTGVRPYISKIVTFKKDNDASFRMMEWRMFCESYRRMPLTFAGEIGGATPGKNRILVVADADEKKEAGGFAVRVGTHEVWNGSVDAEMVKAIRAAHHLRVRETAVTPDGSTDIARFEIDMAGLASVWPQLTTACSKTNPLGVWPQVPAATIDPAPPMQR